MSESRNVVRLEPWTGPWPDDDPDANFKAEVALYSLVDPLTTIEGLSADVELHPLQAAFLELQAGQCGYCLSGIVMSAKALLDRNPTPSRGDIVAALDRHLCRCGAHQRILRAVERAAVTLGNGGRA